MHGIIFSDLLRKCHRKSIVLNDNVKQLERRLLFRWDDPYRATKSVNNLKLLTERKMKTVAKKTKRREINEQKPEKIHRAYTPTYLTMNVCNRDDVERLRSCRYLRIDSSLQIL